MKKAQQQFEQFLDRNASVKAIMTNEALPEATKKSLMEKIIILLRGIFGYFNTHPTVDLFYVTSDEMPFFKESDAVSHSKSQADKTIYAVAREDMQLIDGIATPDFKDGSSVEEYTDKKWTKKALVAELELRKIAHDNKSKNEVLIALLKNDDVAKAASLKGKEGDEEEGGEGDGGDEGGED